MIGTATMSEETYEPDAMKAEIARLAPLKQHKLGSDMTDGRRPLSIAQMRMVLRHLNACPDRAPSPDPAPAAVRAPRPPAPQPSPRLPGLAEMKDVPAGYYATPSRTGNNDLDFWRVDKGTGKWEGYSFPCRVLGGGAGEEMHTVELDNIQKRLALQAILRAGLEEAQIAFAKALDRCTECGRALTDDTSRTFHMGPVCRSKKGIA